MNLGEAALLGVVQGLTEFLPVSSSGHLVLAKRWLGLETETALSFEVVVHVGTLLAVLLVYRGIVLDIMRSLPKFLAPSRWKSNYAEDASFRLAVLVGLATLPTVLAGLFLKSAVDRAFASPSIVPWTLLLTALLLASTLFLKKRSDEPRVSSALAMGFAQVLALLPGVSRSGSTIVAGLHAGMEREAAGRFSFMMAIPAIVGAVILELGHISSGKAGAPSVLIVGLIVAFVSGVGALLLLIRLLEHGRFWIFSPYLLVMAILAFVF
ncbi:MAG: undecaprenyl-diphosphate phosphatase [Planctomycetota bacterium]